MDSDVLVGISVKGVVVVWFCFINDVVALLVILKFVPAVVVKCEYIVVVRCVSLLFAVEALVEVVVAAMNEEEINSYYRLQYIYFNVCYRK